MDSDKNPFTTQKIIIFLKWKLNKKITFIVTSTRTPEWAANTVAMPLVYTLNVWDLNLNLLDLFLNLSCTVVRDQSTWI